MANRYKSAAMLRDDAKGFMNGNYGRAIGVAMILVCFNYVVSIVLDLFDRILTSAFVGAGAVSDSAVLVIDIIYATISLALSIVLSVFSMGMSLFYLKIGCKAQAMAGDLFVPFREDMSRSFAIAFRVTGVIGLAMLPGNVMYSYYTGTGQTNAFYAAIACFLVGGIIAIYVALTYQMSFFIMHDFAEYSASEVLSACSKKMKGHKWRLFRLELSFIPYLLLAVATLGIGILWVYPVMQEARAQFYLDLMNPKKVSDEWERTV